MSSLMYTCLISTKMIASGAREAARLDKLLSLRSLIALRLLSSFGGYFLLSVRHLTQSPSIYTNSF